jgi:bifunctional non-homologous end joining protein LigD
MIKPALDGHARRRPDAVPFRVRPMLATLVEQPFHRSGWIYEEKYDGVRILAYKEGPRVTLVSRNMLDRTASFPAVAEVIARLAPRTLLLDGEVAAFDRGRVSRFQLLQQGAARLAYAAFDCLYRDGRDVRHAPLEDRRRELEAAVGATDRLVLARRLGGNGLQAYARARRQGFEGIIAKDAGSRYEEGRSAKWLKVKVHQQEEFVIGGFTRPSGARSHFGALLLGAYEGPRLRFVGKVGTGFSQATLADLRRSFEPLIASTSPFQNPPRERGVTWLTPRLVAQIAFHEWTADRRLRQPAFLGLRADKAPRECVLQPAA